MFSETTHIPSQFLFPLLRFTTEVLQKSMTWESQVLQQSKGAGGMSQNQLQQMRSHRFRQRWALDAILQYSVAIMVPMQRQRQLRLERFSLGAYYKYIQDQRLQEVRCSNGSQLVVFIFFLSTFEGKYPKDC